MEVNLVVGHGTVEGQIPKTGDFTVCSTCGEVGTFSDKLDIIPATEEQLDAMMDKWPEAYMQMNAASYYINQLFEIKSKYMKKVFIDAHRAIHNPKQKKLMIDGTPTEIQTNPEGLRYVIIKEGSKEYEVVQQNPKTRSAYAQRAKEGENISWLIPHYFGSRRLDGWKVITDSTPVEE